MSASNEKIKKVPDGYTSVTPWLITRDTEKMISFLQMVFDSSEIPNSRIKSEDGKIIHVVVKTGDRRGSSGGSVPNDLVNYHILFRQPPAA
ncbi:MULTISPECIES: hypothetical protein [Flavobacterium]|uniref:Uncharacterized protein n=1 Tax=Flavobacterium endoglycinae TaxID=2816357 RepID=A0ABX7QCQ6_9FLAO|nr:MULTISPECIES: hypothetical protein [Flavobacterium]QSW88439.1 hypothetical protein J0383_19560 [Flavobacterium endoglycinae]